MKTSTSALLCFGFLPALIGFSACEQSEARNDDVPGILPAPYPGCENEQYERCDVRDLQCQEQVFSAVRCIRGSLDATLPPSTIITVSQYLDAAEKDDQERDLEAYAAYEKGCILLGLAEEGQLMPSRVSEKAAENIAAYYDNDDKMIVIVNPDGEVPAYMDEYAHVLLAHEYVHAMQDQQYDLIALNDRYYTSTDNTLALKSLIEGEARLLEDAYLAAVWGEDYETLDFETRYANMARRVQEWVSEDDSPLNSVWYWFPYTWGAAYVRDLIEGGGRAALDAAFANPPTSSAAIYPGLSEVAVTDPPPVPPAGYELLYDDSFGAQIFTEFLRNAEALPQGLAPANEAEVNESWLGDRIYIYRNIEDDTVIVLWRLRLGDTSLAATLEAYFQEGSETRRARTLDNGDLLLSAASSMNALSALDAVIVSAASGETMTSEDIATEEADLPPLAPPMFFRCDE